MDAAKPIESATSSFERRSSSQAQDYEAPPNKQIFGTSKSCLVGAGAAQAPKSSSVVANTRVRLGPIEVGDPANIVNSFAKYGDCAESEQTVDCQYQAPSGLIYSTDDFRVLAITAMEDRVLAGIELPFGLSWSDTFENAVEKICKGDDLKWSVLDGAENGTATYVDALHAFVQNDFEFSIRLIFRNGTLDWISFVHSDS